MRLRHASASVSEIATDNRRRPRTSTSGVPMGVSVVAVMLHLGWRRRTRVVSGSARRPVSARNTSSRLGSRTPRVSGERPSASSVRSASTSTRGPSHTSNAHQRPVGLGLAHRVAGEHARRLGGPRPGRARPISTTVAPRRAFSSPGVPSAMTTPVVDDHDLVGEPVGLLEVLGGQEERGAPANELLDHAPEVAPALRVEAGRRLVEEQHRRAVHERGGEVEPAAHAAGVGARRCGRRRR